MWPLSFSFFLKKTNAKQLNQITCGAFKRHQNSHDFPPKRKALLFSGKDVKSTESTQTDIHSMTNPPFSQSIFFFKRDLKISTPIMRLYSQLTSGQILFSALSNWEFFMAKDKKTGGWKKPCIKESSKHNSLVWNEVEARERRRKEAGRRHGKAMHCQALGLTEMSRPKSWLS